MQTVLALIDHPNLDRIIVPVVVKLRDRGVKVKVLIAKAGRTEICSKEQVPYSTEIHTVNEFLNLEGDKLFLNAADQYFDPHKLGRDIDEICRSHSIPSLTVEHGPFAMAGTLRESLRDNILFCADKMAVIGKSDFDIYTQLGVSPDRLLLTGFPPFDEYSEFIRNKPFKKGDYIYLAGCNHPYVIKPSSYYERSAWTAFLKHIYEVLLHVFPDLDLVIKPHPAEAFHNTVALYEDAISDDFRSRIRIADPRDSNIEWIYHSAFVFSFSSSILLESILLQKNVFCISIAAEMPAGLWDAEKLGIRFVKTSATAIVSDLSDKLLTMMRDNGERLRERVDASDDFMEKYFYKFDGKSSERVADAIISMMEKSTSQIGGSLMSLSKERPVFKDIGFERYQRLMGIAEEAGSQEPAGYTLLDVGSLDGMFRRFVPESEYFSFQGFITGNQGTPYQDNAFDVVVAADVLEHVPEGDREPFLRELVRIARKKVVFSFPGEGSEGVENFILTILPDHRWLKEHKANMLPRTEDVNTILDRLGLTYQVKPNHSLASWVLSVLFDNMNIDVAVRHHINSFMQEQFFNAENRDPAYRYIYTVTLSGSGTPEKVSSELSARASGTPQQGDSRAEEESRPESTPESRQIERIADYPGNASRKTDVSIIIPVFNNVEFTRQCLKALIGTISGLGHEIIIVDNGSTDGTREFLKELGEQVNTISINENRGFAKACNQGALAANGNYLVFLNNDTIPQHGWLTELVGFMDSHPDAGVVGCKLLYPDDTIQHCGASMRFDHGFFRHHYKFLHRDHPLVNRVRELDAVTAACCITPRKLFLELGMFDEGYLNGCEDMDYCTAVRESGHMVYYNPASVIYHLESRTKRPKDMDRENFGRYLSRWGSSRMKNEMELYAEDGFWQQEGNRFTPSLKAAERLKQLVEKLSPQVAGEIAARIFPLMQWEKNSAVGDTTPGSLSEQKKKILFVCHDFPPYKLAGAQLYALHLAKELILLGHDVRVLYPVNCSRRGQDEDRTPYLLIPAEYEGIPVYQINVDDLHDDIRVNAQFCFANPLVEDRFRRLLLEEQFDIVHYHLLYRLSANLPLISRELGICSFATLHDYWLLCAMGHMIDTIGRECEGPDSAIKCATCLTGFKGQPPGQFIDFFSQRATTIRKGYDSIDCSLSPSVYLADIHERFGLRRPAVLPLGWLPVGKETKKSAEGKIIFGYLGQIIARKGLDVLVEALLGLSGSAWELRIYGEVHDQGFFNRILERIRGNSSFKYMGPYTAEDLSELYSGIDVAVIPSRKENYPLTLLEALSSGTPVIASDVGGVKEMIEDGKEGLLFPMGDVAGLMRQISVMLEDPDRIHQMREAIRPTKTIRENAAEIDILYREACCAVRRSTCPL
jgi:GT2 family glycosyltransferase/glycosyltransferase involved in cell wall biosynthesis